MNVRHFTFTARKRDKAPYNVAKVSAGGGRVEVEVTESPTGRSVWVYVNGRQVWPEVAS